MTKSIENRLEKIEKALSIGKKRSKLVIINYRFCNKKSAEEMLGPINQWETYKQATDTQKDSVFFEPNPQKEIEARQRLQNEAKGNDKPE